MDEFVDAVQEVFPNCCIHFEDWTGEDAVHLLARYRDRVCCYNDDVQGTAGITLAGMINACKIKGTQLKDESYLFLGAGSAGIGLSNLLCSALVEQGLTSNRRKAAFICSTIRGCSNRRAPTSWIFRAVRAPALTDASTEIASAIKEFKPTTIIGVSTKGGAFTQQVVEAMSQVNERPVILALSNPTEHAECTAEQAYRWTMEKQFTLPGSHSRRWSSTAEPSSRDRRTTFTSSLLSAWRFTPRGRSG